MAKLKLSASPVLVTSADYVVPGLTQLQIDLRSKGLGASDAEKIMSGNWADLWREKTGRAKPEDLSQNLAVQMGKATEGFNSYWFTVKTGIVVDRSPDVVQRTHLHRNHDWMLANIDGIATIDKRQRLFEAKHTNSFNANKAETPARYYAQIQHALEVTDLEGCELSVFYGNSEWAQFTVERDRDYAALLIEREQEFWQHVQKDTPPEGGTPASSVSLDLMQPRDMRTSNQWCDLEVTWISTRPHKVRFDDAESRLKALMPGDCDFAFGAALVCVRNRVGSLSLRVPNNADLLRMQEIIEHEADEPEGLEL